MTFLLSLVTSRVFPYIVIVVLALGSIWYVYHQGELAERQRNEIAMLQEQARLLREDAERKRKAAEEDAKKAEEDAITIALLDAKTKELLSEIEDPARQCFTADDVDRLRKLWD